MEVAGLVTRRRDPNNRRVHHVALTDQGEQLFAALRGHVAAFDAALRTGLREGDLVELRRLLDHLAANVASPRGGDGDRGTVSR
jgi:MarR family transcriptional regulator for hemolysin